jgi:hypothetical protein
MEQRDVGVIALAILLLTCLTIFLFRVAEPTRTVMNFLFS